LLVDPAGREGAASALLAASTRSGVGGWLRRSCRLADLFGVVCPVRVVVRAVGGWIAGCLW
jgi:hypothetical protein